MHMTNAAQFVLLRNKITFIDRRHKHITQKCPIQIMTIADYFRKSAM